MTYLVSMDIFMCGVATLLQIRRTPITGIGLPVVLGCAVEYVAPLQSIGKTLAWDICMAESLLPGFSLS